MTEEMEKELNEEINENTELVNDDELSVVEPEDIEEPEAPSVASLILGGIITAGLGYATYKAFPKIKAGFNTAKKKREERKNQRVIKYAVENNLASIINEETAKNLADESANPATEESEE